MRITRVAAGAAVAALCLLGSAPAGAWPVPATFASGGACTGSVRMPISWSITNLETAFPLSPARIENVSVSPSLPTPAFFPLSLPNIGTATATATTPVPTSFSGTVTLNYRLVWEGPDGSDQRDGTVSVQVEACPPPPPPTTTTTTTVSTTPPTGVQFSVPPSPQEESPTTTTTTTTTPITEVVAGESVEAEAEAIAVRPVAVQATPQYTG